MAGRLAGLTDPMMADTTKQVKPEYQSDFRAWSRTAPYSFPAQIGRPCKKHVEKDGDGSGRTDDDAKLDITEQVNPLHQSAGKA